MPQTLPEAAVVVQCKSGIVCLALAFSTSLCMRAEPRAEDHEALRALRGKVTAAINDQDLKALSTCFTKDFAFTSVDQELATTPQQIQATFDKFFHGPAPMLASLKVNPEADALTRFLDDHTGFVTGVSKDVYVLKGGKTVVFPVRWSATVVKDGGVWKVATAHVGADPLDNPILSGAVSFWKLLCLVSGIGGLAAGFLAARLLRPKA